MLRFTEILCFFFVDILQTFYAVILTRFLQRKYGDFTLRFTEISWGFFVDILQTFHAVILTRFLQRKHGDFMLKDLQIYFSRVIFTEKVQRFYRDLLSIS